MKILLIIPASNTNANLYDSLLNRLCSIWPPVTLRQLEAITPSKHEVELVDENYEQINFTKNYDLVGITYFTATAYRAYKIADRFREKEVKVVLGGYHASAMPNEAIEHADAVVIGEAENTWKEVLKDAENRSLKSFYSSNAPSNMNKVPQPTLTKIPSIIKMGGIEATRGCPFGCEFCALSNIRFGRIYRKKSIEKVVDEIKSIPYKYFAFYDGSLTVDLEYTKELFRKIKPLNKKFAAFGHANMIRDEEFLKIANEAGCIGWDIGFESIYQTTINQLRKNSNIVKKYKQVVEKLHDYNMGVIGSFAFGFDDHTRAVFKDTFEAVQHWEIDSVGISILTPLPGTKLFDRLEKEGRILTKDWSKYDLYNVVFQPKKMHPQELYDGTAQFVSDYYTPKHLISRLLGNIKNLGLISSQPLNYHLLSSRVIYKTVFNQRIIKNPTLKRQVITNKLLQIE